MQLGTISPERLLAEIDEILKTAPPRATFRHAEMENMIWRGRASAAIAQWSIPQSIAFDGFVHALSQVGRSSDAVDGILTMLHRARADLRMRVAPVVVSVETGEVFEYFDRVRQVVEKARRDSFFIDQYLDPDFASRYLPMVHTDAGVRLLTSAKYAAKLAPAVEMFCQQTPALKVAIRSSPEPHERWLFIDGAEAYQSGASFKDGARLSPASFTQISDAYGAIAKTYEDIWARAAVVR